MAKPPLDAGLATAWLAAIVAYSDDAIISKDLDGIITSWNRGAQEIFGYTADEAVGRSVTMLIPENRLNEEPGILDRIRKGERIEHYETVRKHRDGRLLDISLTVSPILAEDGSVVGASKIARDITDHKKLMTAQQEAEMMRRLVETEESERRRIARDLHDHIGQQVTGLRLKIERIASMLADDHEVTGELAALREIAAKIDSDVGFLSWELRPIELDQLGLCDALQSFANEWSRQYGIETNFHSVPVTAVASLSNDLETSVYRITQEALNNILKHAEATNVEILFHQTKTGVSLVVEDNGKGFYPEIEMSRPGAGGLGLVGMRERTELLGGSLEIESIPGRGTTVVCRIPVKPKRRTTREIQLVNRR